MNRYRRLGMQLLSVLLAGALMLGGCLGRSSPDITYFSLLTMPQMGEAEALGSLPDVALGIGPITIPDSLRRAQIATRSQGNQYDFAEFNRWAGVLEQDLAVVLSDNLGHLLGVRRIGLFPWMPHFRPDYRILVDVQRLDGQLSGEAVLSARWVVADARGRALLAGSKSDYRLPVEAASYAALVRAESQLVAALSRDIATAVLALE